MTTLNSLPVIVTKPGIYRTRNNRRVLILEIKPNDDLTVTTFNVKGCLANKKGKFDKYNIWHESGRYGVFNQSGLDIIEFIGDK